MADSIASNHRHGTCERTAGRRTASRTRTVQAAAVAIVLSVAVAIGPPSASIFAAAAAPREGAFQINQDPASLTPNTLKSADNRSENTQDWSDNKLSLFSLANGKAVKSQQLTSIRASSTSASHRSSSPPGWRPKSSAFPIRPFGTSSGSDGRNASAKSSSRASASLDRSRPCLPAPLKASAVFGDDSDDCSVFRYTISLGTAQEFYDKPKVGSKHRHPEASSVGKRVGNLLRGVLKGRTPSSSSLPSFDNAAKFMPIVDGETSADIQQRFNLLLQSVQQTTSEALQGKTLRSLVPDISFTGASSNSRATRSVGGTISIIPADEVVSHSTNVPVHPSPMMRKRLFYASIKNIIKRAVVPGYASKSTEQLQELVQADIDERKRQAKIVEQANKIVTRFKLEAGFSHKELSTPIDSASDIGRRTHDAGSRPTQDVMAALQADMQSFFMSFNPSKATAAKQEEDAPDTGTDRRQPSGKGPSNGGDDDDDGKSKFDMTQRIESGKAAVIGALSGGVAATPFAFLHHVILSLVGSGGLAQWEFSTDLASIQAALFALVYRYAVREGDDNPMLSQGVIGAFVLTRTLANIQVSPSCSAVPLDCGPPLGYLDWSMVSQVVINGVESAALFGAAALAVEFSFSRGVLSKFK